MRSFFRFLKNTQIISVEKFASFPEFSIFAPAQKKIRRFFVNVNTRIHTCSHGGPTKNKQPKSKNSTHKAYISYLNSVLC